jgi:hypothetical protein
MWLVALCAQELPQREGRHIISGKTGKINTE